MYRSIQKLEGEGGSSSLASTSDGASMAWAWEGQAVSPDPTTKQHSITGFSCWRLLGGSGSLSVFSQPATRQHLL